jgi:hypothetical protein
MLKILTRLMARAKTKPPKKQPLTIHSLSLTKADETILERISTDATDYAGRKVSGSAIIRALLRNADKQGYQWILANICPLIDAEILSGVMWGKKK